MSKSGSGASEEKSFENVNGRTDARTEDRRKVITIAHPEHSLGELIIVANIYNKDTFLILVGLVLNGQINLIKVILSRSVYLTTPFLGRLSPLSDPQYLCTFLNQKLTAALLESAEGGE